MEWLCLVLVPLGFVVVILLIWVILTYNRFVKLRQHLLDSWSGIDVELKRRYDLIPNLVSTVKGYARHESEVIERVVAARTSALASTGSPGSQAGDEQQLVTNLGRMLALAESYPDLKADRQFQELQDELVNTEDRLAAARRFYNGNVRTLNSLCESFPTSLVARLGSFEPSDFFEIEAAIQRSAPPVEP